ncbi:MAG: hypothetical protein ACRDQA_22915 [Nocardioidaceae bacterium]
MYLEGYEQEGLVESPEGGANDDADNSGHSVLAGEPGEFTSLGIGEQAI